MLLQVVLIEIFLIDFLSINIVLIPGNKVQFPAPPWLTTVHYSSFRESDILLRLLWTPGIYKLIYLRSGKILIHIK